uniref:Transposase (Putative), gypsy type n=1 Tax=Tanacetum cinerariifolium TaxID=118510 RepID=A0A699HWK4_TANCI|nr:hypothetical protein [Tanacetum cinerariifolium]
MSAITDIRCVLTKKTLDALYDTFRIPEEVHPIFPNQNDTMHERPAGKIRLYTRNGYFCFHPYPESYQIAPDRADSELEASVERLFDEGGSGTQMEQRDFARGGLDANIHPVVKAVNTVVEDVALVQARRQEKRKSMVVDVGGVSRLPKKLKEDHETLSGASVGGKSPSALQRLLAEAMLNAKFEVAAISTLPFVTAYVSTTPKCEDGDATDFVAEPNLHTIGASQRFVISSDSSHHSGPTIVEAEVDSLVRSSAPIMTTATTVTFTVDSALVPKEKPVKPLYFLLILLQLAESIPTLVMTHGSRLNDGHVCREMVDEFAHPKFFASVRGMEHDQLFTEFNVGSARQMSLSAEVRMHAEYNVKDKRRLKSVVKRQDELLKARDREIKNLKAQLLLKATEAGRNDILEKERNALDVKVIDLEASVVGKECDLTDLNAQLKSIKSQNGNFADRVHELEISSTGLQEKITVYDNCMEQLEEFQDDRIGAAISRAIEKGMQSGLAAAVDHGREGRSLTDVAAYNLDPEADFNSSLQKFREVDFPLLVELKSHKDASTEDIMNVLRLEGALADASGINDLQPDIEQLKVPIHRSEDQVVLGETSLLFSLKPLSVTSLMGEASTSGVVPATSVTTTAISTTFASTSSIRPISIDDYEIVGVDGQEGAGTNGQPVADGNVAPFPNIEVHYPVAESAWVNCLHFVDITLLEVADIPGPSYLGPGFPMSFARLESLSRYTRSPGLKLALQTLKLYYFSIFVLLFASRIVACSLFSSKRSRLILKASSFCTRSASAVLNVGMSISAGTTASISYVNENRVSPLLDFIMVWPLVYGCLTEAKCWQINSFSHQSLNGLSWNYFPLSEIIAPGSLIVNISHAPEPSVQKDPFVNRIHGSGSSSSTFISVSSESSSGRLTIESASIYFLTDTLVLKNGKDFSDDLAKNLFRLASFPFNLCMSFNHFEDGRLKTASTLSGHTFSPLVLTLYPKNIPSSTPKVVHVYFEISSNLFVEHLIHQTLCFAICLGTPVISAGFQAKISKLRWSRPHNLLWPPSVRVEPIITARFRYSRFISTLTLSSNIGLVSERVSSGPETNAHSSGTNLLLFRAITPPSTGSFRIP